MFANRSTVTGRRGCCLLLLLMLLLFGGVEQTTAQPYRFWQDTTLPEERVPKRMQAGDMPIGLYVYNVEAIPEIWDYAQTFGFDFLYYTAEKWGTRWSNYQALLNSAPSGMQVIPFTAYSGVNGIPSYLTEGASSREVLFFPFDSSQMADFAYSLFVQRNMFTYWSYDTLQRNASYSFPQKEDWFYPEAVYDTGMANQVVASGLAFGYRLGQQTRWEREYNASSGTWENVGGAINSRNIFRAPTDYPYQVNGDWKGNRYHIHRGPHFIGVRGHLFDNPSPVADTSVLLRINVWYEVNEGQTYYDSSGVLTTADTNIRFLYRILEYTRNDLKPTPAPEPDYSEYHEAFRRVDFRTNRPHPDSAGMGGPTDTLVTAQDIDLEVIYLGGEKLALHSIAIRDSIYNLLVNPDPVGDAYRQKIVREIDTLIRNPLDWSMRQTVYNLYLTDEPPTEETAGFRETKRIIQNNFIYPGNDSLSTGNGGAMPHLQHIGDAEWAAALNYYEGALPVDDFTDEFAVPYNEVPSIREHNGGRFHIPELLRLDSLTDSTYLLSVPGKIFDYNETFQRLAFGAHLSERDTQTIDSPWFPFTGSRVHKMALHAEQSRQLGRRRMTVIGPTSSLAITYNPVDNSRDTLARHRPEPTEIWALATVELVYGAKLFSTYALEASPWMDTADDGGPAGFEITMGIAPKSLDTTENIVDWTLYRRGSSDSLGIINDYYLGFNSIPRTLREINAWLKRLAPVITRLRWRDAYSMHWQTRRPGVSQDLGISPRPLPSDEIVTAVTARNPLTGAVDSAWQTYVEIGLFETETDTTGGVHDPLKDSNYIFVSQRRAFSRENYDQAQLGYSDTVKAILDTLTEIRTITLDFRLGHPDTTQYAFIRVREVEPDLAELPLIGIREPLDTIIHGDSAVELTLGPGRAALLEVTYEPGDESITDGELWWSNQRKMVYYEDDRFHCTYLRNDTVFYRRSNKMGDPAGSIVWEALERVVSIDPFSTRIQNWGPSITMRAHNGDTIATISWTCHSDSTGVRDVVLRDMVTTSQTSSPIHFVDYHTGTDSTQWGDVVINAAHGGDIIAWGDSLLGVVARVRNLNLFAPPVLSAKALVSSPSHTPKVGRWPTVPTFAHRASLDSNCGIAWNQPMGTGWNSEIIYARIVQLPAVGGVPGIAVVNRQTMSAAPAGYGRPSMDQSQDVWHRVQEGLAWQEEDYYGPHDRIWFRSLYTPTGARPGWDSIETTQGWDFATVDGPKDAVLDCYPTASSLNEVYVPADSVKDAHFTVSWVDYGTADARLFQGTVQYSLNTFKSGMPLVYAYDGDRPQGSSSIRPQEYRHAILYETDIPGVGPVLRTTRQYFGARAKPTGYTAEGRSVHFPIDDSASTYIEVLMHDPWVADDASGKPLDMIGRTFTGPINTLSQVEGILRTEFFAAGDSTCIGIELAGRFRGDSSIGGAARVSLIAELVDSASGTVVQQLDSIPVSATADSQHVFHAEDYDLLSGTYYIRVRLDTAGLTVENRSHGSRYPVAEYASRVGESPAARAAVRLGPTTGNAVRISAQPNPFGDRTEIRFSIHRDERVTIVIVDASGREVARPVRDERFEAGRYAVEFETGNLVEGTYVMELRAGSTRAVEKLIVRH